ncbi:hypothetical protein FFLO_02577 [Filobasidium floriforme]|uniref:Uncharacterized protein n=1 Tax=Filobasidium floriforme TaxID=5210 RepID=A0A8K0NTY1_9TREE|nr:hypothetical protein FFLO_02577 [Filobasidium floriforme]
MVAMTNLGQSRGADLIVGTLGLQIKCQYKPGDLVLFNSHLVAHGITPFLADKKTGVYGKRTALVLFSHKSAVFHKPTIAAPARNLGSEFQRYGANVGSDLEGMAL